VWDVFLFNGMLYRCRVTHQANYYLGIPFLFRAGHALLEPFKLHWIIVMGIEGDGERVDSGQFGFVSIIFIILDI
jgi:hypothetical protein